MRQVGFYLDAGACSGCKACQVACKDRNGLGTGVLWRRVYEVVGGGWRQEGAAWVQDVVAYNLSIGCNHCGRPICAEVCPAGAMQKRADGVVMLDRARCMGCGYCAWACPYGAPQYDPAAGRMGKCDGCVEEVEAGRPPVCVAACGLRALEFGELDELIARHGAGAHLPPLPAAELTEPALVVGGRNGAGAADLRVANTEEVSPPGAGAKGAGPLVAFTLLAQIAVGVYWGALAAWAAGLSAPEQVRWALAGVVGLIAAATLASLGHLGTRRNAWRALTNLRRSWLSREILLTGAFGAGAALVAGMAWAGAGGTTVLPALAGGVAGCGGVLVYAMARVYRLRTIPTWDRWQTTAEFFAIAALAGILAVAFLAGTWVGAGVAAVVGVGWAVAARVRFYGRGPGAGQLSAWSR